MSQNVDRVVIFPRFTSFVGATTFYSPPMDVRDYAEAILTVRRAAGLGTTPPDAEFVVQESADLEVWNDGTTFEPDPDTGVTETVTLTYPWLRVKVTITGDAPGITCWMLGELVRRAGMAGGPA